VSDFVAAMSRLPEHTSLKGVVNSYLKRHPIGLPAKTVREIVDERIESKPMVGKSEILTRPAPKLSDAERAEVKKVARVLLDRLKQLLVPNWRQKSTARSQLKLTIEDTLDIGLLRAYDKPLYEQKCSALFEPIYESYPERVAAVYAAAT